jgi:trimethylamine-N-oxide reductase cytochrome c-type subunit TorC
MKKSYLVRFSGMAAVFGLVMCLGAAASAVGRPSVDECMRCHDVKRYQHELKNSVHAFDKDKKEISCEQCHIFHFNPLTSYYARDKYYDKKIFEPGTFDRRRMQRNARQTDLTAKCQECHKDLTKNVKGEPISQIGGLAHDAFLGKNGTTRKTCAGCHVNIAHLPKFDRDLMVNAEFVKRLVENPPAVAKKGGE